MTVQSGPGKSKTRHVLTDWPVTSGLTAGTERQEGRTVNLVAENSTRVPERFRKGLD